MSARQKSGALVPGVNALLASALLLHRFREYRALFVELRTFLAPICVLWSVLHDV
jgi:hypothetical protein